MVKKQRLHHRRLHHRGGSRLDLAVTRFSKTHAKAQLEVMPSGLVDATETFASDTGQMTTYTETGSSKGTVSFTSGQYQVAHSGAHITVAALNTVSYAMPQVWVQVDVALVTGNGSTSAVGVGIFKDGDNYICGTYNNANGNWAIRGRFGGTTNFGTSTVNHSITFPATIGFSLVENSACIWVLLSGVWTYINGYFFGDASWHDFRPTANLSGYNPGFITINSSNSPTWGYDNLSTGRFGRVGIRDITMVTKEDGTAYFPTATSVMFTASCPDPLGKIYQGVFSLDLTTYAVTQTGVIMVNRDTNVIYPDVGGHIIYYGTGERKMVLSTWGNRPGTGGALHVQYVSTSTDILNGTNVLTGTTIWTLPQTSTGSTHKGEYDPMMVYDTVNARWMLAYIMTDDSTFAGGVQFYPATAYSTDLTNWTLIAKASSESGYEGAKLYPVGSTYKVLVGGPVGAASSSHTYDALSMTSPNTLDCLFEGAANTLPQTAIFEYNGKRIILSFDNEKFYQSGVSFTWGRLCVYEAKLYTTAANKDTYFEYMTLGLHMDGTDASTTFTDVAGHTMTAHGNAQIDTAQFKYGSASGLFDGTGDYVTAADSADFTVHLRDFTIEFFVRFNALPTSGNKMALVNKHVPTGEYGINLVNTAGTYTVEFTTSTDGTTFVGMTPTWSTPSTGKWYHVSCTRRARTGRVMIDGTKIGSDGTMSERAFDSTSVLSIGGRSDAANSLNGWLDDVRLIRFAYRWANFTAPTKAFLDQ